MQDRELIYDWNEVGSAFDWSSVRKVELDDETLRDGLQNPSVVDPSLEDKVRLLHMMDQLGIHTADIGLPGAGPRAVEAVTVLAQEIVDAKLRIRPNCAARTVVQDVRPIAEISQKVGIPIEACTFIGSSPIRQYAEGWTLDRMLKTSEDAITFAVSEGLPVMMVTEDTTRAKPEVLKALYGKAIEWGARRLCIADTVGHATPEGARALVRFVIEEIVTPSGEDVEVDWHGHRDRGFGLANSLAAIEAGATRVHGTALGIGERCGNTEMDLLLVNLKLLGVHDADLTVLPEYCELTDWRPRGRHHQGGGEGGRLAGGSHLLRRTGVDGGTQATHRNRADVRSLEREVLAPRARLRPVGRGAQRPHLQGGETDGPHTHRGRGSGAHSYRLTAGVLAVGWVRTGVRHRAP